MIQNKQLLDCLDDLKLVSSVEDKHELVLYFASNPENFYNRIIYNIVGKWNGVLGNYGSLVENWISVGSFFNL